MSVSRPTVPEVLPFLRVYLARPENSVGGSLHIITDDGNYDNHSVAFCLKYADEHGDKSGMWLAGLMLRMSKTQRRKLCWKARREKSAT